MTARIGSSHRYPDEVRRPAVEAVLAGWPVKEAAAMHRVSPDTLRTWLAGERGVYEKPPRISSLPKRHCIGHSPTSLDGRCEAWFHPESKVMFICPICRRKN